MSDDEMTPEEMSEALDEAIEEIEDLESTVEEMNEEITSLKEKVTALEEERKMEGWAEWGEYAASQITREELTSLVAQSKVTEDILVSMFRRGIVLGIEIMEKHVEKHIDDAWAPYAKHMEEGSDD